MNEQNTQRHGDQDLDVAIVGGGSAGLIAALTLARARRQVVVIDAGQPRNTPAAAAHGLLGLEGINPLDLLAKGRDEASRYGARIVRAKVVATWVLPGGGFELQLEEGSSVRARQVLVATGVCDELPDIPGLAQRWGRDVVHCPYCHGWEIRGQRIGLLATGLMSAMQAMLFGQWTEHMLFFPNGLDFPAEQYEQLAALGIGIVLGRVEGIDIDEDRQAGIRLDDGSRQPLDALAVPAFTRARLEGLEGLRIELQTRSVGVSAVADETGRTSVPGVWAAGNVVDAGMQVSESAANGARVAMTINTELVFQRSVQGGKQ